MTKNWDEPLPNGAGVWIGGARPFMWLPKEMNPPWVDMDITVPNYPASLMEELEAGEEIERDEREKLNNLCLRTQSD